MAISSRNKVSVNFSSVGMTDVVFNLLIFFMLPQLSSPHRFEAACQREYPDFRKTSDNSFLTKDLNYFVNNSPLNDLEATLKNKTGR
jgi:hypothetical protein